MLRSYVHAIAPLRRVISMYTVRCGDGTVRHFVLSPLLLVNVYGPVTYAQLQLCRPCQTPKVHHGRRCWSRDWCMCDNHGRPPELRRCWLVMTAA